MGMDVVGRKPITEDGKYFRANCWSWRPIKVLIEIANQKAQILDEETLKYMDHNDGAGPKTQKACTKLADALEELIKEPYSLRKLGLVVTTNPKDISIGFKVDPKFAIIPSGEFVFDASRVPYDDLRSPYFTQLTHIKEFIQFLRGCGGFQVC